MAPPKGLGLLWLELGHLLGELGLPLSGEPGLPCGEPSLL